MVGLYRERQLGKGSPDPGPDKLNIVIGKD